ncbi:MULTISPECIES: hypothetical protein [Priestia]|uniref:Uncharacterized protein n=1 Tax=Priestia megaterium TaxID=1404 RepID=A0A6M6DJ61_PRIMG|nr:MULTISPECIES: hypothetical protein [Priestia]MBX9971012.1 hypothetical protein [Priestia aryabhattai]MED4284290.1 hypothetical protein [Priestia megaterium]QJX74671.1 hypothetical protein FDZ14_00200 [Priestia megaterium]
MDLNNVQVKNLCNHTFLTCDKIHKKEEIKNLLRSSIKAIQHNKGKVIVKTRIGHETIYIKVEDNRNGILQLICLE